MSEKSKIFKGLKDIIDKIRIKDYADNIKKSLFDHHKKIVVSIMEESPVLQIIKRSDLQIHNFIADEESTMIELIRNGVVIDG